MAVNFGPLAAEAVTSVERPFHTYLEKMRRRVARLPGWAAPWRCSKYLSPKVSGYQRAKSSRRRVADEVKVADLLGDDAQPRAGTESLYLWAEDLAESHILEVKG